MIRVCDVGIGARSGVELSIHLVLCDLLQSPAKRSLLDEVTHVSLTIGCQHHHLLLLVPFP